MGSEDQPAVVEVIELDNSDDTGLIETPEARERPRAPASKATDTPPAEEGAPREERPQGPRRARGSRNPKPEPGPDGNGTPPKQAAE